MTRDKTTSLFPEIIYDDAHAALEWLTRAFGFTKDEVIAGPNGSIAHSEMHYGDVTIMPKSPMSEWGMKSPRTLGGISQCLYVTVDDPDAHCRRARAAGAEILMEPRDMEYGARNYIARDLEGHIRCFGTYRPKPSKPMSPLERLMHGPERVRRSAKTLISMNYELQKSSATKSMQRMLKRLTSPLRGAGVRGPQGLTRR